MLGDHLTISSAFALREQLELLELERAAAAAAGLTVNGLYMRDLVADLEALRRAYTGAAVTEIASLRAALGAPLLG